MRLRISTTLATTTALAAAALAPVGATAAMPTPLRLDGIGPLKLGMTRAAAVSSGWLSHRSTGCELASPVPVTYRLDGGRAPKAINGSAEFARGKLTALSFNGGVRTAVGVQIGSKSSDLLSRYRKAGFTASSRYEELFGVTFLTVKRQGRQVLGGLAKNGRVTQLAVPMVRICE